MPLLSHSTHRLTKNLHKSSSLHCLHNSSSQWSPNAFLAPLFPFLSPLACSCSPRRTSKCCRSFTSKLSFHRRTRRRSNIGRAGTVEMGSASSVNDWSDSERLTASKYWIAAEATQDKHPLKAVKVYEDWLLRDPKQGTEANDKPTRVIKRLKTFDGGDPATFVAKVASSSLVPPMCTAEIHTILSKLDEGSYPCVGSSVSAMTPEHLALCASTIGNDFRNAWWRYSAIAARGALVIAEEEGSLKGYLESPMCQQDKNQLNAAGAPLHLFYGGGITEVDTMEQAVAGVGFDLAIGVFGPVFKAATMDGPVSVMYRPAQWISDRVLPTALAPLGLHRDRMLLALERIVAPHLPLGRQPLMPTPDTKVEVDVAAVLQNVMDNVIVCSPRVYDFAWMRAVVATVVGCYHNCSELHLVAVDYAPTRDGDSVDVKLGFLSALLELLGFRSNHSWGTPPAITATYGDAEPAAAAESLAPEEPAAVAEEALAPEEVNPPWAHGGQAQWKIGRNGALDFTITLHYVTQEVAEGGCPPSLLEAMASLNKDQHLTPNLKRIAIIAAEDSSSEEWVSGLWQLNASSEHRHPNPDVAWLDAALERARREATGIPGSRVIASSRNSAKDARAAAVAQQRGGQQSGGAFYVAGGRGKESSSPISEAAAAMNVDGLSWAVPSTATMLDSLVRPLLPLGKNAFLKVSLQLSQRKQQASSPLRAGGSPQRGGRQRGSGGAATSPRVESTPLETLFSNIAPVGTCGGGWAAGWLQSLVLLLLSSYQIHDELILVAVRGGPACQMQLRFITELMAKLGFSPQNRNKNENPMTASSSWILKREGSDFTVKLVEFKQLDASCSETIIDCLSPHTIESSHVTVVSCPMSDLWSGRRVLGRLAEALREVYNSRC